MSSEYRMETLAPNALATIVLSQKDNEYRWRSRDAVSKTDLFNSMTGYFLVERLDQSAELLFGEVGSPQQVDTHFVNHLCADYRFSLLNQHARGGRLDRVICFNKGVQPDVRVNEASCDLIIWHRPLLWSGDESLSLIRDGQVVGQ